MKQYYVYVIIDPSNNQPFYVGKGSGDRMYRHKYDAMQKSKQDGSYVNNKPHHQHIRYLLEHDHDLKYEQICTNCSNTQALNEERKLIERLGRKVVNTGPLLNISRGGQQGGEVCKPVTQYTLDGIVVAVYPSAKTASESVIGANRSYITQCCKKNRVSAGGFLWAYEHDRPAPYAKQSHQAVNQYTLTGTLIATFVSLTTAENSTGVKVHNICQCCRGKSKTAGGFIWKYLPN